MSRSIFGAFNGGRGEPGIGQSWSRRLFWGHKTAITEATSHETDDGERETHAPKHTSQRLRPALVGWRSVGLRPPTPKGGVALLGLLGFGFPLLQERCGAVLREVPRKDIRKLHRPRTPLAIVVFPWYTLLVSISSTFAGSWSRERGTRERPRSSARQGSTYR